MAALARAELARWDNGRRRETDPEMTAVLQGYYRTGVGREVAAGDLRSATWQRAHPWSAVFVSWVMRQAGAGPAFTYSAAHRTYVAAAKRNAERGDSDNPFWAYPVDRVVPEEGDLVCADRRCCATCRCNGATYDTIDNGHGWCTHCDIVVGVDRGGRRITVVGGNVDHSVGSRSLRIDAQGFLVPGQSGCGHFAVVKVRDVRPGSPAAPSAPRAPDAPGAPPPSPPLLDAAGLAKARRLNRSYGASLGWRGQADAVARLVGRPGAGHEEGPFALAVATWQRNRGLAPDGIVGPDTWAEMRRLLADASSPGAGAPAAAGGAAAPAAPRGVPPLDGPRVPAGYRYGRGQRGLVRYSDARLDATLAGLRRRGLVAVDDATVDTFQRIANVETGGAIQGLNTWDSAVVSSGFMQWTLQHGKLQEWVRRAPSGFRRYGIEVDPSLTYSWGTAGSQPAIAGAPDREALRWDGWAERFYLSGLDEEVIAAEAVLAREWLGRHLRRIRYHLDKRKLTGAMEVFRGHYEQSLYLRGIFHAAYNNLPVAAINGTVEALRGARAEGDVGTDRFVSLYADAVLQAYRARGDDGRRVVSETKRGAQT